MDYIKVGGSGVRRMGSFNRRSTTLGQAGKGGAGKGSRYKLPVAKKRSANCKAENHAQCWMLTCGCKCHTRGE